jgi:large subunit ribosomal protein L24
MTVKKNDQVVVLAGADKNKRGKVLEVDKASGRVVVEGVRIQSHHKKPKKAGQAGGIQKTEGPVDASNVQLICPECGAATRVSAAVGEDGKKVRLCKKCGKSVDKASAKPEKAKKPAEEKPDKSDKKPKKERAAKKKAD